MKKWDLQSHSKVKKPADVLKLILQNRNIKTKKEIKEFLNPRLSNITVQNVGIDKKELGRTVDRIKKAIKNGEQIIIFGDYDVDGITGAAILWETLNAQNARVLPYIPHRIDEGYGLSKVGIQNLESKVENIKLIITVDNGIVANEAVNFANEKGIDVIITDHHVPSKNKPFSYSIVHTTKLCGAGVAYMLAQEFKPEGNNHLELVALASIADLVPLVGANRTLTKFGLEKLSQTQRLGLLELFKESGLDKKTIGTYEVGHIIAPRLNAMGRLESGMDSLRLICTKNINRAKELARKLSSTNSERQNITQKTVFEALAQVKIKKTQSDRLLFVAHESYQQGVIGLVAGKLVEEYYLPSIVVSKGDVISRASARSISGLNIIEFIRSASDLLVDAGGHPMAAGFTVETAKLELVQKRLEELAQTAVTKKMLNQTLRIDCELSGDSINPKLYDEIEKLQPFGMGNPTPTFMTKKLVVEDLKTVGFDGKHLKFKFSISPQLTIDGIWFGGGDKASDFKAGNKVDIVYTIDQDLWNGNKRLQLKIKDLKVFN